MKIIIFRIGNLGDSVAALPAFNALRQHYAKDEIILLSSKNKPGTLNAAQVLGKSGFVDQVIEYEADLKGLARLAQICDLRKKIASQKADLLIYLAPSFRSARRAGRDKLFFTWCGIKKILGLDNFMPIARRDSKGDLLVLKRESQNLLAKLESLGISTQNAWQGLCSGLIGEKEKISVDQVLENNPKERYIAIGIGGKGPAQKWPLDCYKTLGRELISQYHITPVIFGGPQDFADAQTLVTAWSKGKNVCGVFNFQESLVGFKRCALYIGNDTGSMHLAALAGVRCVAIFSARSNPGLWEPMGDKNTILRKSVPCQGCEKNICDVAGHPCLSQISVQEVLDAAKKYLTL